MPFPSLELLRRTGFSIKDARIRRSTDSSLTYISVYRRTPRPEDDVTRKAQRKMTEPWPLEVALSISTLPRQALQCNFITQALE
jgi:hypothetical protein